MKFQSDLLAVGRNGTTKKGYRLVSNILVGVFQQPYSLIDTENGSTHGSRCHGFEYLTSGIGSTKQQVQGGPANRRPEFCPVFQDKSAGFLVSSCCKGVNRYGLDCGGLVRALESGESFSVGHTVAGNRLRMAGQVRLKPDWDWIERLPDSDRRTCWRLSGWLMKRYDYPRQAKAA